ncbi:MAG: hypothetical protein HC808_14550 [Candidatus Competibacteraceae bacterium]|nr:hypothetical protein [Candidatus Competibacteraceae bacterium]
MSIPIRITLTALFLFGLAGGWLYPRLSIWHEDKPLNPAVILISEINCDPALATCVARGEGVSISLSLQGPVRVLTPFPVTLQLDESVVLSSINRITVSFLWLA